MCFSPAADLAAGLVVGALGVDALRHVRRPAERALAALPLILAGHQVVEAAVWWGLQDRLPDPVWRTALWLYLAIAFGVVPVLVPMAVAALEPESNRRRVRWFTSIGAVVSITLMYAVVRGPIEAAIRGHHIEYRANLSHGGLVVALYVVATCGALLVSTHPHVRWFGAVNLVAVGALVWLNQSALISLWCAWAAVASAGIAVHLRHVHPSAPPQLATSS